ncbi:MAG: hypothetical protein ABJN36_08250 [Cyclobacteriaceae bacterium]
MKTQAILIILILAFAGLSSCENDAEIKKIKNINDVGLRVSFTDSKATSSFKNTETEIKRTSSLTYETPENYFVALKKATLKGANGTPDFDLFNELNLASSFVFDYTNDNVVHSLLDKTEIPDGTYTRIEIEIYYLQMNIAIATGERGVERRNIRVYLSDDAETEEGLHQPGDMTQINDGKEIGWLLGEGQMPNMDPVTPRVAAYTHNGEGTSWYDFAGKSAKHYGPFGDVTFMNNAPHPVYSTVVGFHFKDKNGSNLILDFNVNDCWQFEDKSGDGVFGPTDLDPIDPTKWHMALPVMTMTRE